MAGHFTHPIPTPGLFKYYFSLLKYSGNGRFNLISSALTVLLVSVFGLAQATTGVAGPDLLLKGEPYGFLFDTAWRTVPPSSVLPPLDQSAVLPPTFNISCPGDVTVQCDQDSSPSGTGNVSVTDTCDPNPVIAYYDYAATPPAPSPEMRWVYLPPGAVTGNCVSGSDCETGVVCFGLQYTPGYTGNLTSYTTGFFVDCYNGNNPVISNSSCVMNDNSLVLSDCEGFGLNLMNSSGNTGGVAVVRHSPIILHQVCFQLGPGGTILLDEDEPTDLTTSIDLPGGDEVSELPYYDNFIVNFDEYCFEGCPYPNTVYRRFVVTDNCANEASCVQEITITDTTAPDLECPEDTIIDFGEDSSPGSTGQASAVDNCDASPSTNYSDVTVAGGCLGGYTITRRWISTDACLNADTCYQTITVQDLISPVVSCPPDVVIDCTADTSPAATGMASATDNLDGNPSVSYTDFITSGACPQAYTISRQWIAVDACFNRDTCYQTITVQDVLAPLISCPPDITIQYPSSTLPANTGMSAANDNCDPEPMVTYTDSMPGACPRNNFIRRLWTATDACGNESSCVQWIHIEDHGTICGHVDDDFTTPIGNVTISLYADVNENGQFDSGVDTLVSIVMTDPGTGDYCFTDIPPCHYILVESQPSTYGDQYDYDLTADPDGDDSTDGPDNEIPVVLDPVENDLDNNFRDILCPTVFPEVPNDTICDGGNVTIQIEDLNLGSLTYTWNFGSGATPSSGDGLGPHVVTYDTTSANQAGGASVVLTIHKEGCTDLAGEVALMDINPYPNPAINASTSNICYYTNRSFVPVAPEIPGASYFWTFGSGAVPATANSYGPHNVQYTTTGSKTVKLVIHPNEAGAQCADSSQVSFTVTNCPGGIIGFVTSVDNTPIVNVMVQLFVDTNADGIAEGGPVKTVFSGATGQYSMGPLTPGNYVIIETQPSGWFTVDDFDASDDGDVVLNISSDDNLIPVTILPSEIDSMNNFIESPQPGSITGSVFVDLDNDMVPDPGEGVSGVTLSVYADAEPNGIADNSIVIASAVTNAVGNFFVSSLPVGNYVLVETNPANYLSIKDYDASPDGDAVPNTNMNNDTIPVTIGNNETDAQNYFIDQPQCSHVVTNTLDGPFGSLRYVIGCAEPGDTIIFDPSLANQTIQINSNDIVLDKDLVFNCTVTPAVTIASAINGLFEIQSNIYAEFINLHIVSGLSPGNTGAAFENMGILRLKDVIVTRNSLFPEGEYLIRNHPGSAIFLSGSCQIDMN